MSDDHSLADRIAARRSALSVAELAEMMNLCKSAVYSRVANGKLPAIRLGAILRFDPKVTAEWLRRQSTDRREKHGKA